MRRGVLSARGEGTGGLKLRHELQIPVLGRSTVDTSTMSSWQQRDERLLTGHNQRRE